MINDSKNAHKPRGLGSDSQPPKSWQGGSEIPRSSWPVNESGQIKDRNKNRISLPNMHKMHQCHSMSMCEDVPN